MKLGMLFFALCCVAVLGGQTDSQPTYHGLTCIGWVKPEASAVKDGDSAGESLVINTPLAENEKKALYYARQATAVAWKKEQAIEEQILKNHNLLFPLNSGSEWMREDGCGVDPMIRSGEYHITQFVPSNPKYPSQDAAKWQMRNGADKCRAQFAEMRKRAVTAQYGRSPEEDYKPR